MNPTQTGMAVGVAGSAITLHAWALLGFPVHDIPEVPAQIEAIATAMVTLEAWASHSLYLFARSFRGGAKPQGENTDVAS